MRYTITLLAIQCLAGCAAPPLIWRQRASTAEATEVAPAALATRLVAPRPASALGESLFMLSLEVEAQVGEQLSTRNILPGDTLHSGDGVALYITLDRAAYVYVVNYSPTEWSTLHFPSSDLSMDQIIQAQATLRVPSGGSQYRLRLDEKIGVETFIVVASLKPIDSQLCEQLRLPYPLWQNHRPGRGNNPDPKPKKSPPPPTPPVQPTRREPPEGQKPGDREGILIDPNNPKRTMRMPSDPQGLTVLRFSFKHEP